MTTKTPITVAPGDGIGPEIMTATLKILEAANALIVPEFIELGEKVYLQGNSTGISEAALDSIRKTKVLLKAPVTTPQGGGYKSVNVTLRKRFGLFANVRPCKAYYPAVFSNFPDMDLVIIRENEEGLYAGIEHRQTENTCQTLKLFSRQGCERIIRYAFEYATAFSRRKITCMSKDNIMKMTDGMFHKIFDEIAKEYPGFETEHLIIDIGAALLATRPQRFDVIVTENLYGDIISDVAAQVAGSVGLAGSANIGLHVAMFEAIHGSAPDIAGKQLANPSGLLNAAVQMLIHIGQPRVASIVQNAWLKTIEDGIHTADIYSERQSKQRVTTHEFAEAVIARLGEKPVLYPTISFSHTKQVKPAMQQAHQICELKTTKKELVGVDIFVEAPTDAGPILAEKVKHLKSSLKLMAIMNRGLIFKPQAEYDCTFSDHWCCRFQVSDTFEPTTPETIIELQQQMVQCGFSPIKTENLYTYDGVRGFSLAQGQ